MKRAHLVSLLIIFTVLMGPTSIAHEPDTFTVIVRNGEHTPSSVSLVVNDTVQYKNEDHRENVTHYIGFDGNEDGDFDDEGEFSSGPLNATCDWLNDTTCRTAWILPINSTSYVGVYTLTDYTNTNESHNITLIVEPDVHGALPEIGTCFGDCEDESQETNTNNSPRTTEELLQLGGAFTLMLGLFLGLSILSTMKKKD